MFMCALDKLCTAASCHDCGIQPKRSRVHFSAVTLTLSGARVVQLRKAMPSPSTAADGSFLRPLGRRRGNASPGAAGIFPLKPGKMP